MMRNDLESGVVLSSAVSLEPIERHQKTSEVLERQIERRGEQIDFKEEFPNKIQCRPLCMTGLRKSTGCGINCNWAIS